MEHSEQFLAPHRSTPLAAVVLAKVGLGRLEPAAEKAKAKARERGREGSKVDQSDRQTDRPTLQARQ